MLAKGFVLLARGLQKCPYYFTRFQNECRVPSQNEYRASRYKVGVAASGGLTVLHYSYCMAKAGIKNNCEKALSLISNKVIT